jgi:hypothetical protein
MLLQKIMRYQNNLSRQHPYIAASESVDRAGLDWSDTDCTINGITVSSGLSLLGENATIEAWDPLAINLTTTNPDFITPQSIHALKANVIPSIYTTSVNMLIREIETKN